MTERESFPTAHDVSADPSIGEAQIAGTCNACRGCLGQGVTDDRGWPLVGQPYFCTQPCERCNGTGVEPHPVQPEKSIPVLPASQRGSRLMELVENVSQSWWESPMRERTFDALRIDRKEARVARAVRLYLHLFYGKP